MKLRKAFSIFILIIAFSLLLPIKEFGPVLRLMYVSFGLIWLIKIASIFFEGKKFESILGLFCYLIVWPGISTSGFRTRLDQIPNDTGERFLEHWLTFIAGLILLSLSIFLGEGKSTLLNYLALFSVLLIVHLGLVEVVRDLLKLLKFNPNQMFNRPFVAESLKDFWSLRWNKAFVEMNKVFFISPFRDVFSGGVLVFSIFIISGFLHEIGISYSSGMDFGKPLIYFFIQGLGFLIERRFKLGRIGTILVVLLPFPLLFPPSFVNLFFGILGSSAISVTNDLSQSQIVSILLIIGGLLQGTVLLASIQVPKKLNWKIDLEKLNPFNKKVFWTYGGYIFVIIIFMAVTSVVLGIEGIYGISSKLWIVFILLFWLARVLVDMFYYTHEDWPKGPEFVIGHICLTTLFITLVIFYSVSLYISF